MPLVTQESGSWSRLEYPAVHAGSDSGEADARPAAPAFMARRRHDVLSRTIIQQIVPRLVLARGAQAAPALPVALESQDVSSIVDIVLREGLYEATQFVECVASRGVGVEAIYLDLLAPAARRLGALWDDDLVDFTRVAIGLGRLTQVLGGLSVPFQDDPRRSTRKLRVLLVPSPGDSHSFGMAMVASFFQRAGWSGWAGVPTDTPDLLRMVRDDHFAVVGFSASSERRLDALASAIRSVRRISMNRDVRIMVGGPMFMDHPELVALVGADATASDGRQAVLQAQNLLTLIPSQA